MKIEERNFTLKNGELAILFSPTTKDAQQLADYYNTVIKETRFLADTPEEEKKIAEEIIWIENTANAEKEFIVAVSVNDKIIGLGNIKGMTNHIRAKHRCVLGISVQSAYWKCGVSSQIMATMIEYSKILGFEQIELEVCKQNISAINLYKKFGFIETGYRYNAVKYEDGTYEDLIFMQKDLKGELL